MLHELELIEWIAQTVGDARALRDDTFWDPDTRRIYTTDMMVEGQHFSRDYFSAQDVGWKAATVNISDIAATGGRLKSLLISIAIPPSLSMSWIQDFYYGLAEACERFGGIIAGGDTVGGTDRLVINITAIGECPPGHYPGHRFNARPGDYVLATGFHGLSHTGLCAFQNREAGYAESKAAHLRPQPRIEAGLMLASRFERYALMDSSDGLADALVKIAQSSGQTLLIDPHTIPIHPEVSAYGQAHDVDPWQSLLYGGEDFELIATVPFLDDALFPAFHVIGHVVSPEEGPEPSKVAGAWLMNAKTDQSRKLSLDKTYQHFDSAPSVDFPPPVLPSHSSPPPLQRKGVPPSVWAVVAAGGNGCRFSPGSDGNKLLADLQGQRVLQRTLGALLAAPAIQGVVLVTSAANEEAYRALVEAHFSEAPIRWAVGGADRRESVFNGLCALPEGVEQVVIHDAARPLVQLKTLEMALSALKGDILGAVVGIPVHDTLKRTEAKPEQPYQEDQTGPSIVSTLDRRDLWRVQTPQVFRKEAILQAHHAVSRGIPVTDDAQLMEMAGLGPVVMVAGEERNLKITTAEDLRLAAAWLSLL